ncbi:MAG TPA: hypothetical protein VIL40_03305, partial [Thermaerobacter sp.]
AVAAAAGLDVLFVPAGAAGRGWRPPAADPPAGTTQLEAPRLRVVPVTSLAEAVAWLCQHGGQGPPCG